MFVQSSNKKESSDVILEEVVDSDEKSDIQR